MPCIRNGYESRDAKLDPGCQDIPVANAILGFFGSPSVKKSHVSILVVVDKQAVGVPSEHVNREKNPGWSGYLGDETLPRFFFGIIINHYTYYKDAY